jgi:hypothetical protein
MFDLGQKFTIARKKNKKRAIKATPPAIPPTSEIQYNVSMVSSLRSDCSEPSAQAVDLPSCYLAVKSSRKPGEMRRYFIGRELLQSPQQ